MTDRAYVYILASQRNGTLYIGVTKYIAQRTVTHHAGGGSRFVDRYKVHRLVHVEPFARMDEAIAREKQLKHWNRAWKLRLIEESNPNWDDLFEVLNA